MQNALGRWGGGGVNLHTRKWNKVNNMSWAGTFRESDDRNLRPVVRVQSSGLDIVELLDLLGWGRIYILLYVLVCSASSLGSDLLFLFLLRLPRGRAN